jgi:hypothetical protein
MHDMRKAMKIDAPRPPRADGRVPYTPYLCAEARHLKPQRAQAVINILTLHLFISLFHIVKVPIVYIH